MGIPWKPKMVQYDECLKMLNNCSPKKLSLPTLIFEISHQFENKIAKEKQHIVPITYSILYVY